MLELKPGGLVGPEKMQHEMNLKDEALEALDPDGILSTRGCLEFVITLLRPFSQGTMWMWRHRNETATPRMNPGYLTDERDITALVQGKNGRYLCDIPAVMMHDAQVSCSEAKKEFALQVQQRDCSGLILFAARSRA